MIITLFGPPGAGKGTQGARLAAHLGVPHLSTGDMLREITASGSDLGREIASVIDAGHYVSDEMARDMVARRIDQPDCTTGVILDGFPRTRTQARMLDELLSDRRRQLDAAVLLEVADATLVERIAKRAASQTARSDDRPEVLADRLRIYREKTQPVLDLYAADGRLMGVPGEARPEIVFNHILQTLSVPA